MNVPDNTPPTPDVPTPEINIDPFNEDLPANRRAVSAEAIDRLRKTLWSKSYEFSMALEQLVLAVGWKDGVHILADITDGVVFNTGEDEPSLHYRSEDKRLWLEIPLDPHCRDTRQMNVADAIEDARLAREQDQQEGA